ncbi:hypothetical protein JJB75_13640 [Clostridium perfringens]|uniref:Uncharacterized protein n=1 Tax=Clostridium perfringens TaxID=1502 RepID=A0ABD4PV46_CLOPF|nr:hypothetical protein [Clostridium perfringens]ELC8422700.1 hypothetical protein [Clostridium perfringens]MBO3304206.1 hypothetical protein [Clostridium perfringens]MBO3307526.1 hypothetical protein [Clostridium perfringens]MBO3310887.1 hypothetical protein [Clostridium perfringens]MBO3317160.1 hypothetical protein [Clostridium perfringens]
MKNKKIKDIEVVKKEEKVKLSKEEKLRIKEEKKAKYQEQKELKRERKNTLPSTRRVLPFIDIDEDDIFITKQGYLDIYQINTRDTINLSESERKVYVYSFIAFLRNFVENFKIIIMNFPVNTVRQQEYIEGRIADCTNEIYINYLKEELDKLKFMEKHRNNKEYFLMVFMKNEADREAMMKKIELVQNIAVPLRQLDLEKKIKILFKLNNMNTKLM